MAVSNDIIRSPCVIFLGAGASRILGLMLMKEFVNSLKEANPPEKDLFDVITKQKEDLEYLFEQLSELETKEYLTFTSPQEGSNALGLRRSLMGGGIKATALNLSSWLRGKVFAHYRQIDEDSRKLILIANIFRPLLQKSRPLAVFTTNYDPVVEVLSRKHLKCSLLDGFRHDASRAEYVWDRDVFDKATFPPGDSLVLFKLHGSANWIQSGARILKSAPIFGGEDTEHKNVLIFPATRKIAIADPYFTCYDYLGKCLANAKLCLVVGYSFRDYDALTGFKAAKIQNPSLRILVMDPAANAIIRDLADNDIQSIALPFAVGIQDTEYLSALSAEVDKVFGKLAGA
jgi:hypothetical protein